MNLFFLLFPPIGGRGCTTSLPPHPLTTIDPALRFKGTSLRNSEQRSWDVHRGYSHAGEGLLVVCGVRKLCFRSQAEPVL